MVIHKLPEDCGNMFALVELRGALVPLEDLSAIINALRRATPAETRYDSGKYTIAPITNTGGYIRFECPLYTRAEYDTALVSATLLNEDH